MREPICDIINLMTWSLPGVGIHHLGITSEHNGELLAYESTASERPPCYLSGVKGPGVGARPLDEILEFFANKDTKILYYGLRAPLYQDEVARLDEWLVQKIGLPYDMDGTLHAGGGLLYYTLSKMIRGEDLSAFFCSELCAAALSHVGRFQTPDISKWNPNKLVRRLVRTGVCERPVRLL